MLLAGGTPGLSRVFWPCTRSHFSRVRLFVTPRTVAHQAPLSMGFSRQEYCSGLPSPSPGDLPDPRTEPTSLMSPALAGRFFTTSATREAPFDHSSTIFISFKYWSCLYDFPWKNRDQLKLKSIPTEGKVDAAKIGSQALRLKPKFS